MWEGYWQDSCHIMELFRKAVIPYSARLRTLK
jgi:hypothetical protein